MGQGLPINEGEAEEKFIRNGGLRCWGRALTLISKQYIKI
jgi:hypothetical protein